MKITRIALASAALLLLAGCLSLGGKPPKSLLNLTPTATVAAGTTINGDVANAIAVLEPETPAKLAVTRVPVQMDDTQIAYVKEVADWVG